jgi:putative endonuclease
VVPVNLSLVHRPLSNLKKYTMLSSLKTKATHLLRGKNAEDQAFDFLISKGLKPICRNYSCKQGELDLVMNDQQTLVIIEVRYRKSDVYGSALESVTASKQKKIITATQHYLSTQQRDCPLRFDVVAISGNGKINWIKNAF